MKGPLLAIAVVLASCRAAPVRAPPGDEATDSFRFVGGGSSTTARLLRSDYLWSAVGEVQRFADGYRGTWRGETVDLRTHEGVVEGWIGSQRTELHLEAKDDGFFLRGMYRGQLGELWVGAREIEGNVGRGSVSVARTSPDAYVGFMPERLGADRHQRALVLPVAFASLPREQQALYLALIIGA